MIKTITKDDAKGDRSPVAAKVLYGFSTEMRKLMYSVEAVKLTDRRSGAELSFKSPSYDSEEVERFLEVVSPGKYTISLKQGELDLGEEEEKKLYEECIYTMAGLAVKKLGKDRGAVADILAQLRAPLTHDRIVEVVRLAAEGLPLEKKAEDAEKVAGDAPGNEAEEAMPEWAQEPTWCPQGDANGGEPFELSNDEEESGDEDSEDGEEVEA